MKEKIFSNLKAAILVNGKTSISDKTLNSYVDSISAQITEESQIAEAIKPHVNVLKEIQANINSVAAESVTAKETVLKTEYEKKIRDLEKANPKPGGDDEGVLTKEDLDKYFEEKLSDAIKPYKEKLETLEKEKASGDRNAVIASKMKELGLTDDDMKFVSVPEDKDVTEFLTGYRQNLIDRGLKQAGGGGAQVPDGQAQNEVAANWLNLVAMTEPSKQ
jgi:hypothetical protein